MVSKARHLIVNADDFGQSAGVNRGIVESFERGIVTSASLMVRWPWAREAAGYARQHPELSVGLHLDLGEWAYRDREWLPLYEVVRRDDGTAVAAEIARQMEAFREMMGREPSHIDSHQHVHRAEPVRSLLVDCARRIGVPLRLHSPVRYCGAFYGQTDAGTPLLDYITVDALKRLLEEMRPGITELGCHPAAEIDFDTMYGVERLRERDVLCSRGMREYLMENAIDLCSFAKLPELAAAHTGDGESCQ